MDLKETYNKIAKDWDVIHPGDDWWVVGADKFAAFLKPGDSVVDVGCGAGGKSKYLSERGLNVIGIDFSERMIEIAEKKVPSVKFYVRDMKEGWGFDDRFDGIFANAVLLHIPKKEIARVINGLIGNLKPGGYFYASVKEAEEGGLNEEVKIEIDNDLGFQYERFFSYFTLGEMKNYFEEVGLRVCYENIALRGGVRWIQVIGRK